MKLTPIFAKQLFEKIRQLGRNPENVLSKLTGKDSINYIFDQAIYHIILYGNNPNKEFKSRWQRLQFIFDSSENSPGEQLTSACYELSRDLTSFYKKVRMPKEADYKLCIQRVAQFIAFYSDTEIPDDIVALYTEKEPSTLTFAQNDLIENPITRLPVALCLDTSGSMMGEKITELNRGVSQFFQAILDDDIAKDAVEICIVTFSSSAKKEIDFANINRQVDAFRKLKLEASGNTAMGTAVNMALDLLEARKKEYNDAGVQYWQPWLVLMTDGQPTDDILPATERACQLINDNKLTIFPIGIGDGANMARLKQFSPKREPMRLKGLMITEFFNWLGKSVKTTSQSTLGSAVKLPPTDSWSSLYP